MLWFRPGLSPLARGTPPLPDSDQAGARFIPAGAGNTRIVNTSASINPVYPRWRGEHTATQLTTPAVYGLSPLARGTPAGFCSYIPPFRFIPAGAGNMLFATQHGNKPPVYPRWRGEHTVGRVGYAAGNGLSPLARGTRANGARPPDNRRFIPAGAGNTGRVLANCSASPVYPRWRGEHAPGKSCDGKRCGLSPLARGTQTGARA